MLDIIGTIHQEQMSNHFNQAEDKDNKDNKYNKDNKDNKYNKYNNTNTNKNLNECHKKRRMPPVAQNILYLLLKKTSLNQRTIAKNINFTNQAVSESIKKLECHELIIKKQGELNNENIISLTEKGVAHAKILEKKLNQTADSLFLNFSDEELYTLFNLLAKIKKNQENKK